MRYLLAAIGIFAASGAVAQTQHVGPLDARNNLSEISSAGSAAQSAARANIGANNASNITTGTLGFSFLPFTMQAAQTGLPGISTNWNQYVIPCTFTSSTYTAQGCFVVYTQNGGSSAATYSVNGTLQQTSGSAGSGGAGGRFTYVSGNFPSGDGGAIQLDVFQNSSSASNYSRGAQVNCWGPQICGNGIVFINQISPTPNGYFHNGIAFNESFGNVVDTAFITDNGSNTSPVSVQYGTWYDGSTVFSLDEYEGPGFRIGPTPTNYNSKVEVDASATGNPTIIAAGSGATPAANATLGLGGRGTGTVAAISPLTYKTYTVAGLPACNAANANAMVVVTDATAISFNSVPTGGGSNHTPVFCSGSGSWTER